MRVWGVLRTYEFLMPEKFCFGFLCLHQVCLSVQDSRLVLRSGVERGDIYDPNLEPGRLLNQRSGNGFSRKVER